MSELFATHALNAVGRERATQVRAAFSDLLEELEEIVGTDAGRELAIARTKLEEACFFVVKAVAVQARNQDGDA